MTQVSLEAYQIEWRFEKQTLGTMGTALGKRLREEVSISHGQRQK